MKTKLYILLTFVAFQMLGTTRAQIMGEDGLITPEEMDTFYNGIGELEILNPTNITENVVNYTLLRDHKIISNNKAMVMLEFDQPVVSGELVVVNSNNQIQAFAIAGQKSIIRDLPLNESYSILGQNTHGDVVTIGSFDTRTEREDLILCSQPMMERLNHWSLNSSSYPHLLEAVVSNNATMFEKVAFYQSFYEIQDFPVVMGTDINSMLDADFLSSFNNLIQSFIFNHYYNLFTPPTCKCKTIKHTVDVTPNMGIDANGAWKAKEQHTSGSWNSSSRYWFDSYSAGPSRWQRLASEGFKSGGTDRSIRDSTNQSAIINLNIICVDDLGATNAGCVCEKTIDVNYYYKGDVSAKSITKSGAIGAASKYGTSKVEDGTSCVFVTRSGSGNTIEVMDVNVAGANSHCEKTVNNDFYTTSAKLTFNIAIAIATGGGSLLPTLLAADSLNILNQVNTLINTPYWATNDCNHSNTSHNLTGGFQRTIYANKPSSIILSSSSYFMHEGKRGFGNDAIISSEYALSVVIPQQIFTDYGSTCCNKQIGVWESGSFITDPALTLTNSKVGSHFGLFDNWDLDVNPFTQQTVLTSEVGNATTIPQIGDPCSALFSLENNGNIDLQLIKSEIYDILGRKIAEINHADTNYINYITKTGTYIIIKTFSNNATVAIKQCIIRQ